MRSTLFLVALAVAQPTYEKASITTLAQGLPKWVLRNESFKVLTLGTSAFFEGCRTKKTEWNFPKSIARMTVLESMTGLPWV